MNPGFFERRTPFFVLIVLAISMTSLLVSFITLRELRFLVSESGFVLVKPDPTPVLISPVPEVTIEPTKEPEDATPSVKLKPTKVPVPTVEETL